MFKAIVLIASIIGGELRVVAAKKMQIEHFHPILDERQLPRWRIN